MGRSVRLPLTHPEVVRHDPVAGIEGSEKLRTQLAVDFRPEVEGHDRRLAEVRLEQVFPAKFDPVGHARLTGGLAGSGHQLRVGFHADGPRPEPLGGHNGNAPVPASEIKDHVRLRHVGRLQHAGHHPLGRRDVRGVLVAVARVRLDRIRLGRQLRVGQRLVQPRLLRRLDRGRNGIGNLGVGGGGPDCAPEKNDGGQDGEQAGEREVMGRRTEETRSDERTTFRKSRVLRGSVGTRLCGGCLRSVEEHDRHWSGGSFGRSERRAGAPAGRSAL